MNQTYLRGSLFYADLGDGIGSEQKGFRPVVIIQNNVGNRHSPAVIVAAVTSKTESKAKLPTHYYIGAESGLGRPSIVLLEQLRTIDKQRLSGYIGKLDQKHIQGIDNALAISVGLMRFYSDLLQKGKSATSTFALQPFAAVNGEKETSPKEKKGA